MTNEAQPMTNAERAGRSSSFDIGRPWVPLAGEPWRTADPAEAFLIAERQGAAILTGWATSDSAAVGAAHAVFAERVVTIPPAAEVRAGGVGDRTPANLDHTVVLGAHTDGFAYGDRYPDYFMLLCAQSSPEGGESFLVDGYALLTELAATDTTEAIPGLLESVAFDQTEPDMRPSLSPLVGRAPDGRPMLRRFPYQRVAPGSYDPDRDRAVLHTWNAAIDAAAASATRFRLAPGEAAIIDNYRVFHGREPYSDLERLMWRVWIWTTGALGVPEGQLHSDSRYAAVD